MSAILQSASVVRVREALAAAGITAGIVELPGAARTAKQAADFLGCNVAQIANSLVFRSARDEPLLVMSSGARRVDLERLAKIVGDAVGKADADFVRQRTGFAIGGVAPVGHAAPLRTFVDPSLAAYRDLWAAAGHPHTVFRLSYAELVRITNAVEIQAAADT
jgi:prolyl-tRNA editing enzyme YbaK/EbsC (Cys-tRNA(Pro) deacylase)